VNRGSEEEVEGEGERGRTTWRGGGLAEDDGVLSLVAAVEAGVGYGREKKKLQRREKGWKEKRERVAVAAWWPVGGCAGFLWWSCVRGGNGGGRRPRWREREETSCRGERRSRWLITDAVVAGWWSWQRLVVLVAQGGAGGRNGDGVGFLWRRKKEEEAEEENLQRGEGGRLVFWLTLDPLFSSLRP